jgi:hypothetical protein
MIVLLRAEANLYRNEVRFSIGPAAMVRVIMARAAHATLPQEIARA